MYELVGKNTKSTCSYKAGINITSNSQLYLYNKPSELKTIYANITLNKGRYVYTIYASLDRYYWNVIVSFRPAFNFIDNNKSTNLYY